MAWPATAEELPLGVQNDTDAESGEPNPTEYAAAGGTDPEGEGDHAGRHNHLADAVNRVFEELGTNPSGPVADVAARMAALDLVVAGKADLSALKEGAFADIGTGSTQVAAGNDSRFPTAGQKNALAGANGAPGTGNEYLTKQSRSALETLIGEKQPSDSDLTAIAALETTTFGRALLTQASAAKAREAIETNSMAQYERWVMREGFPEKLWPTLNGLRSFWKPQASNTTNIANAAHLLRFEPPRNIVCRGLSLVVSTLATANDECAVVMKSENGKTTLASSGSVAGKLNAATGRQDIDFTEDVLLELGKIYYPGIQFKAVGGTAAFVATAEVAGSSAVGSVFGNTPPNSFMGAPGTTYPWVGEPAFSNAQNRVFLIVRER